MLAVKLRYRGIELLVQDHGISGRANHQLCVPGCCNLSQKTLLNLNF